MCLRSWARPLGLLEKDVAWVAHVSKEDKEIHRTDPEPLYSLKQSPVEVGLDQLTHRHGY